ncbi:NADP-dependent aryl-alcohol dehydrogenase [Actinoplanes lobatus]|uniref:Aryl-alcohol dehydrogenase-like predicted oxidoreductase n=1 Tax=Actinoplanes lobatus TaxID=113568 RepID=A0A7W7HMX3_9ACTN|nr:aldo/keto reductase [Actinoplanes lobatus]MBB4753486.1 aryl-alcohol dehydrogenase-like predicted oxidoreductase [Actinoplanes lobatus]GGN91867.1 NADP-dependent aryl-alcohol dehydrogenase [Actinoplanes lobatus]GIE38020.1 NADP-dependent aryl-alcohol dehydrogenase [Actinoplanes lobatus]
MSGIGAGLEVFPLALGGNTFGWTSDETASHQVLDAFVEAGGDFLDTADGYSAWVPGNSGGESETIIGDWIASRGSRDRVVIGTKVSQHPQFRGLAAATVRAAADASLKRLRTDHIDLYWAHFDDPRTPLEETAAAFDGLVKDGKIRAVGLSNYTGERIREWFRIARRDGLTLPVAVQPHYNLVRRGGYESDIAPVVAEENLAVVPYYGLASGFLTGKYKTAEDLDGAIRGGAAGNYLNDAGLAVVKVLEEIARDHGAAPATVALAWLRGRPGIAAPIASARTLDQLPALIASATLHLTSADVEALDEVSARVPQ